MHIGHLITAQSVLEKRNLDRIIFIPAYISPHKQDVNNSESFHRFKMLELATAHNDRFYVSDFELKRQGVSYTYDTLKELKKTYTDIELIIGYDNLIVFDDWYKPDEILELCKLIVMRRLTDIKQPGKNKYFEYANILDTPTLEISSTNIRERVKNNMSIDYLVPDKVKEYIYSNGLYK